MTKGRQIFHLREELESLSSLPGNLRAGEKKHSIQLTPRTAQRHKVNTCYGYKILSLQLRKAASGYIGESETTQEMFSLFYGLWKQIFTKIEFHVLILGIDKAGKTTLLEKLKTRYSNLEGLPPDRIAPTVGLNVGRVEVSNAKLVFWDLGGQLGLRSIWEKYYEEAHAVIYVVDASCPSRFEDSKSALEKVLRHEDLLGAPLLILANKQDLEEAVSADELAQCLDLKKLDESLYTFQGVSAVDGLGIKEGINWLMDAMETSKRTELLRARAVSSVV